MFGLLAVDGEVSSAVVVLMGIGTVFVGLICLVVLSLVMSRVVALFAKETPTQEEPPPHTVDTSPAVEDRGAFIAAVSAAIAEESGTPAAGIRITSIRRL